MLKQNAAPLNSKIAADILHIIVGVILRQNVSELFHSMTAEPVLCNAAFGIWLQLFCSLLEVDSDVLFGSKAGCPR